MVNRLGAPSFRETDQTELATFCRLAANALHHSRALQVAQRTGQLQGKAAGRRRSMMGVKRASEDGAEDAEAEQAPAPLELSTRRKVHASIV